MDIKPPGPPKSVSRKPPKPPKRSREGNIETEIAEIANKADLMD